MFFKSFKRVIYPLSIMKKKNKQFLQKYSTLNKDVIDYYEGKWEDHVKWMHIDKSLGIHFGYYEKGIRTYQEAVINMNYFAGRLLDLDMLAEDKSAILDAGCGVGGSSIYLAKKYPHIKPY